MITIYIPTYTGNGQEAVECAACASQTFPEACVIVADDAIHPMRPLFLERCPGTQGRRLSLPNSIGPQPQRPGGSPGHSVFVERGGAGQ